MNKLKIHLIGNGVGKDYYKTKCGIKNPKYTAIEDGPVTCLRCLAIRDKAKAKEKE
jgi:hypothetical protein